MIFKYLLTLLLLFVAPHDTALDPVIDDDDWILCADDWGWEDIEPDYYLWEHCLFVYSGTYDDDPTLSRNDHQALMHLVWSDYMGDTDPPRLRRGTAAVEDVCKPSDDGTYPWGCSTFDWEDCGPWRQCRVADTIAVKNRTQRILLHEVAHAIYTTTTWHPFYGEPQAGAQLGTDGHSIGFRCFLLEIYYGYAYDADTDTFTVALDAYDMLHNVCVANGWAD